ncbi:hypothetical protein E2C01_013585 [Portunus trituberculatus]|uniref:Uncharacterized protein n=1 Tax=Portunus trituberculatus TaxID=210409 RepID=A0A5B7DGN6_PORTR|nr:hypothetical protein [Portunus trituberculatus]
MKELHALEVFLSRAATRLSWPFVLDKTNYLSPHIITPNTRTKLTKKAQGSNDSTIVRAFQTGSTHQACLVLRCCRAAASPITLHPHAAHPPTSCPEEKECHSVSIPLDLTLPLLVRVCCLQSLPHLWREWRGWPYLAHCSPLSSSS